MSIVSPLSVLKRDQDDQGSIAQELAGALPVTTESVNVIALKRAFIL